MATQKKPTSLANTSNATPNISGLIENIRAVSGGRTKKYYVVNFERGEPAIYFGNDRERASNIIAEPNNDIRRRSRADLEHKFKVFAVFVNSLVDNIIRQFKK